MPAIVKERNPDGSWGDMKKIGRGETDKERADRLQEETSLLAYSDMTKEMRILELEAEQAQLYYLLMQGGII